MKKIAVETKEEETYLHAIQKREKSLWLGIASFALAIIYLIDYYASQLFVYSYILVVIIAVIIGGASLFFWYLQGTPSIAVTEKEHPIDKFVRVKELIFQLESVVQCIELFDKSDNETDKNEAEHISLLIKNTFEGIKKSSYTKDLNIVEDEKLFGSATGRGMLLNRSRQLLAWLNERLNLFMAAEIAGQKEIDRSRDRNRFLVDRTHERLSTEIRQLSTRANFYLAVGAVATIFAAGYLYMSAPDAINEFLNINKDRDTSFELSSVIPLLSRLSIALVIEALAFYFLKLHREVMNNAKYYQNELTNIDLKAIGLNAAYSPIEGNSLKEVIGEFSKAERNFILSEKQTTVELEKIKFEKNLLTEALDKVTGLLKQK